MVRVSLLPISGQPNHPNIIEVAHSVHGVKFQSDELEAQSARALLRTAKYPPSRREPVANLSADRTRWKLRGAVCWRGRARESLLDDALG
jgi:hypothetical protein